MRTPRWNGGQRFAAREAVVTGARGTLGRTITRAQALGGRS